MCCENMSRFCNMHEKSILIFTGVYLLAHALLFSLFYFVFYGDSKDILSLTASIVISFPVSIILGMISCFINEKVREERDIDMV